MAYKQQTFISHRSGGWKLKIAVPAGSGSGEGLLPGCRMLTSPRVLTRQQGQGSALRVSLIFFSFLIVCVCVCVCVYTHTCLCEASLVAQRVKNLPAMWESQVQSLVRSPGRCPGEENGYAFQYSCLENSMDKGSWLAGYSSWSFRVGHDWVASTHTKQWRGRFITYNRQIGCCIPIYTQIL